MIKKYRKKPVVVEAVEYDGSNKEEIFQFCGDSARYDEGGLKIDTLEGTHLVTIGDFVIKGVANEFYPCKPKIFWKTYEEVV